MISDEQALLRAILANPADDVPRLVYADWLDEHYEAELAEFIRVQCELANADWRKCGGYYCHTYDTGNTTHVDCGPEKLRIRESELWPRVVGSIDVPGEGWLIDIHPRGTDRSAIVRRGFVAEVRCTLATLFGGACRRCDVAPGVRRYPTHSGDWVEDDCNECSGTGHTPGIAADLFKTQPVEKISLTDLAIWPSGGNDTYYLGGVSLFPAKYWRRLAGLRSRLAVKAETEAVCLEYGRELAGLPAVKGVTT